jgi:hypothetical protein
MEVIMPKFSVRLLIDELCCVSTEPLDDADKVASLLSLTVFIYLDQKSRPRRKPTRPSATRVISTKSGRHARLLAYACLADRARSLDPMSSYSVSLINRVFEHGNLSSIAKGRSAGGLIASVRDNQNEVRYVIQVVNYLVRSRAFPTEGFPSTIEDAKAFTFKQINDFRPSKISKIWEDFKLVAPYLYALSLERSFRLSKARNIHDVLDWAFRFAGKPRRIARFLGHAGYVVDILKEIARDNRQSDFVNINRIVPPLRRFSDEERRVIASIDRNEAIA